jgi:hypothetical protein
LILCFLFFFFFCRRRVLIVFYVLLVFFIIFIVISLFIVFIFQFDFFLKFLSHVYVSRRIVHPSKKKYKGLQQLFIFWFFSSSLILNSSVFYVRNSLFL